VFLVLLILDVYIHLVAGRSLFLINSLLPVIQLKNDFNIFHQLNAPYDGFRMVFHAKKNTWSGVLHDFFMLWGRGPALVLVTRHLFR
jgi:hypothetical protein